MPPPPQLKIPSSLSRISKVCFFGGFFLLVLLLNVRIGYSVGNYTTITAEDGHTIYLFNETPPKSAVTYHLFRYNLSQVEKDAIEMQKVGINVIRSGDMDWDKVEPSNNTFNDTYLDEQGAKIDKLNEYGIKNLVVITGANNWIRTAYPLYDQNGVAWSDSWGSTGYPWGSIWNDSWVNDWKDFVNYTVRYFNNASNKGFNGISSWVIGNEWKFENITNSTLIYDYSNDAKVKYRDWLANKTFNTTYPFEFNNRYLNASFGPTNTTTGYYGNFESGELSNWTIDSGVIATVNTSAQGAPVFEGNYVLNFSSYTTSQWKSIYSNNFTASENKYYTAFCLVQVRGLQGPSGGFDIGFDYFNDTQTTRISFTEAGDLTTTNTDWKVLKMNDKKPPATTTRLKLRMVFSYNGSVYVDYCKVYEQSRPAEIYSFNLFAGLDDFNISWSNIEPPNSSIGADGKSLGNVFTVGSIQTGLWHRYRQQRYADMINETAYLIKSINSSFITTTTQLTGYNPREIYNWDLISQSDYLDVYSMNFYPDADPYRMFNFPKLAIYLNKTLWITETGSFSCASRTEERQGNLIRYVLTNGVMNGYDMVGLYRWVDENRTSTNSEDCYGIMGWNGTWTGSTPYKYNPSNVVYYKPSYDSFKYFDNSILKTNRTNFTIMVVYPSLASAFGHTDGYDRGISDNLASLGLQYRIVSEEYFLKNEIPSSVKLIFLDGTHTNFWYPLKIDKIVNFVKNGGTILSSIFSFDYDKFSGHRMDWLGRNYTYSIPTDYNLSAFSLAPFDQIVNVSFDGDLYQIGKDNRYGNTACLANTLCSEHGNITNGTWNQPFLYNISMGSGNLVLVNLKDWFSNFQLTNKSYLFLKVYNWTRNNINSNLPSPEEDFWAINKTGRGLVHTVLNDSGTQKWLLLANSNYTNSSSKTINNILTTYGWGLFEKKLYSVFANQISIINLNTSEIVRLFNFSSFNLTEGSLTKLYGTSNNLIDDQVPVTVKNVSSAMIYINSTQNYTNVAFKVNISSLSDLRNVRWFYKAKNDVALLIPSANISYQGGMVFDLKGVNISQSTDSNDIYSGSPYWFNNISSTPSAYSSTLSHFNITWNDTLGYSIDTVFIETNYSGTPTNYTMALINPYINTTEKKGVYNYNITLPAGTFYWKSYANSSDGYWNSTPQWIYTVAVNSSTTNLINLTINGTESNKAYTYPAVTNVTAWDSITDNQNITLWRNTTFIGNSTNNITDLAQLAAGFYNYTLRYPGSQNYSSATKQFNLTINTAPTLVRLYLNGSDSDISFGNNNTLNITATINVTGKTVYLDLNATGYGNNFASSATTVTNITNTTILGIGLYNVTAHFDGDANYSTSSSTHFLTITDTTSPQYSNIKEYPTDPTTYAKDKQYQFNITWTDDISINEVILEFNSINYSYLSSQISKNGNEYYKTFNDLSANTSGYLYRWHANDTSNNWQSTTQQSYTINKASPSLSLIISPTNSTTYGTTTVANGTIITGDNNANISLYRNGTIVNSSTSLSSITETILLRGGIHNYTFVYNGTQNYTSSEVTNITVVSQNYSLAIRIFLDGTEGNKTYTRGNTANITATANVTGKNITIEANFTGSTAAVANGTNNVTNITDTSSLLGTYNITAYFAGDSNYTTNSTTYYLTVQTLADSSSCTSNINCAGGYCVHSICRSSSTYSGDSYCDIGETCSSSPNDCGLCGGPAISITIEKEKSIITISYISSTSPKTVNTTEMNADVTSIFIATKEAVSSVKITLEKLLSLISIQPLANTYSYINITGDKIQDKNVKQAKIAFKVSKAWIINNSINESTIALFRYDNQWNKLNTAKLGEDYTSISFEAETPGFSIFAISGEKISEAPPEEEMPTPAVEMPEEEIKIKPWYEIFYRPYTWAIIGIIIFIAISIFSRKFWLR